MAGGRPGFEGTVASFIKTEGETDWEQEPENILDIS